MPDHVTPWSAHPVDWSTVGSSGSKPRKKNQHHLPKVGTPENREYELHQKRKEAFGGWPVWLVGAILVAGLVGWLLITLP